MKTENTTTSSDMTYMFSELKSYSGVLMFRTGGDPTNCKLSYIHGLGSLNGVQNDAEKLEIVKYLLKKCKGAVIINSTCKPVVDFIARNFPTYYNVEVPIGYSNGFQYHICIKNTKNPNSACRLPVEKPKTELTKTKISTVLTSILKKYRRKDDYVKEFIETL